MNSAIRYFGGKSNMISRIIEHFPDEGTYDTYIEPFGGSYSVGLKNCEKVPIEIYNDLNQNVYSLYKVLQNKELYTKFKEKCDLAIYNEDFRKEYRESLKNDKLDIVERAYKFFYVNRTSHNGIGGFSINTVVRRNMSKSVSDMLSAIDRMDELHQRISKIIVTNKDAFELIERYKNNENVFFYLDPPYHWSTRTATRYETDMNDEQHLKFVDLVLDSKAKMLISGYDCVIYDKLVNNGWNKIQFEVNTTGGDKKPKKKIETLWKNYR